MNCLKNDPIGAGLGLCGYAIYATTKKITDTINKDARLTKRFIRDNWNNLLAGILASIIVLTSNGILYGFQAVALPLTIGLGIGSGVGGIIGVLTSKIFDPDRDHDGKTTAWDLLNNNLIERLDANGMRPVMLSISITVLLAASVIYPYALGGICGFLVGNQVVTKIGQGRDLGPNSKNIEIQLRNFKSQAIKIQEQIIKLQIKIDALQRAVSPTHPDDPS